jgi:Zn-dependent peptidase ImmA (M78 family)/transcriptional regulator with XRE-family HTH domain
MALDEGTLGSRLRDARERTGLKQGDIARLVGLDRTAVNKIESGTRRVTALELAEIAAALGVRMSSFFEEPTPALVSHRSHQGLDVADSRIDRILAATAADIEFLMDLAPGELDSSSWQSRLPAEPFERPASSAASEDLARRARDVLGLDDVEPIEDLVTRFSEVGLLVFAVDLGPDTADAGTILLRQGGVSLVNSHNKIGRRRLAAAHELGHYLVADEYTIDWRVFDHNTDIEARLDWFARSLLLPSSGVAAEWSRLSARHELREIAVLLASHFRVDMATLARRLQELGHISADGAAFVRRVTTTQADIVDFGLRIPTDLVGTTVPTQFQKAVLHAFRNEVISRERALELLRGTFADDDLPAPRTRREDEIWNFVA